MVNGKHSRGPEGKLAATGAYSNSFSPPVHTKSVNLLLCHPEATTHRVTPQRICSFAQQVTYASTVPLAGRQVEGGAAILQHNQTHGLIATGTPQDEQAWLDNKMVHGSSTYCIGCNWTPIWMHVKGELEHTLLLSPPSMTQPSLINSCLPCQPSWGLLLWPAAPSQ
jgi:hypothetical protein